MRDLASRGERVWREKEPRLESCGRRGLLWELSREREREKKDVGDIVCGWLKVGVYMMVFALAALKFGNIHDLAKEIM